jgi:hypothetical protein
MNVQPPYWRSGFVKIALDREVSSPPEINPLNITNHERRARKNLLCRREGNSQHTAIGAASVISSANMTRPYKSLSPFITHQPTDVFDRSDGKLLCSAQLEELLGRGATAFHHSLKGLTTSPILEARFTPPRRLYACKRPSLGEAQAKQD